MTQIEVDPDRTKSNVSAHSRLAAVMRRAQRLLVAWFVIEMFVAYAILVLHPLHEFRLIVTIALSLLLSLSGTSVLLISPVQRRIPSAETKIAVACGITLALLCAADVMYGVYFNRRVKPFQIQAGTVDSTFTAVELQAALPMYQKDGLVLYKPNSDAGGVITGDLYNRCLQQSRILANELLEMRRVDYSIDEHGFRRVSPLEEARVIIAGDSFAFGAGVANEESVAARIQRQTNIPCYNSGFGGSGPEDALLRIEYLLRQRKSDVPLQAVLLLLFEGNDLEGGRNQVTPPTRIATLNFTFLAGCVHSLEMIRQHSVISRVLQNRLVLLPAATESGESHLKHDGVDLHIPLYSSERLGQRLFYPPYMHTTLLSRDAVKSHPGMARIRRTLERFGELAREHGFEPIVAVAPTAARVHGDQFADFPAIDQDSPLNREVQDVCGSLDLGFHDLVDAFVESPRDSLLYFRSDTHWNSDGHAVAAKSLAPAIAAVCVPREAQK